MGEVHTVFTGQLTFRRAVSKRLVFYDMQVYPPEAGEQGGKPRWVELVIKEGTYGSIEEVKDLRDRLKLGDVVEATGHAPSGGHELQAVAVTVVVPWRRGHPGRTFVKRPAPPHAAAAEPRALPAPAQQQQQAADGSNAQLQQPGAGQAPALPVAQGMPDAAAAPPARLCKYFVNTGRCAKACCPFTHEQTAALRQRWIKDMLRERQALAAQHGFAHTGGAAAKRRRAQVFAAWLVDTFGVQALNAGDGVLDVAGGSGAVTFELRHVHGVRCTLVDPRPLKLTKLQLRQLQAAGRVPVIHTTTAAQLEQLEQAEGQPQEQPQPAAELALHQVQALFGPELWRGAGWRRRFARGFSLVLAMHPDQATDPALEYALECRLPFAIVPCCVFPRLFPHRRVNTVRPGGGGGDDAGAAHPAAPVPVASYADLVLYLEQRGRAQRAVLPFEGANTVVFRQAPAQAHVPAA